ncbi:MAG: tetratricopeptide repeat protein [Prevotellaceae bacterium]|jgi:tetratricopeptide (TPR) repeat protein|nr:tetratricopeptide repeat protein [Prevotellaceae bacterium]
MQKYFWILLCAILLATPFAQAQEEEYDKEIEKLSAQIAKRPKDASLLLKRANLLCETEEYEAAILDYNKALELSPSEELYLKCSEALAETEDYIMAYLTLSQGIQQLPNRHALHAARADISVLKEECAAAVNDYTAAINMSKAEPDYYRARAWAFAKQKNFANAIADYNEVVRLTGSNDAGLSLSERGEIYLQQENYAAALADFDKAIALNAEAQKQHELEPSDHFYYLRGIAYMGLKNYKAALADFSKAIAIENSAAEYYEGRSQAHEALAQHAEAKKDAATAKRLKK